jgi:hypothetical protein
MKGKSSEFWKKENPLAALISDRLVEKMAAA